MTYEEALTKVLTALGYEVRVGYWSTQPPGEGLRQLLLPDAIDANFVVEHVIPWARAQDLRLRLYPQLGGWYVEVEAHPQAITHVSRNTFREAAIMAVAEALG